MEQSQSDRLREMLKIPYIDMTLDQLHEVRDEITNAIDNIKHQMEMAQISGEDYDPMWYSKAKRAMQNYQLRNRQVGREIRKRHATSPKANFAMTFMEVVRDSVTDKEYQEYIHKTKDRSCEKKKEHEATHNGDDINSYLDKDSDFGLEDEE